MASTSRPSSTARYRSTLSESRSRRSSRSTASRALGIVVTRASCRSRGGYSMTLALVPESLPWRRRSCTLSNECTASKSSRGYTGAPTASQCPRRRLVRAYQTTQPRPRPPSHDPNDPSPNHPTTQPCCSTSLDLAATWETRGKEILEAAGQEHATEIGFTVRGFPHELVSAPWHRCHCTATQNPPACS